MEAVSYTCGLLVALVFFGAGLLKLTQPTRFASELADYEVLPSSLVWPVAIVIPLAELSAAALTVIPATHAAGAMVLASLLAIFSAAVARNLRLGNRAISCACFGTASRELSSSVLVKNALLAAAALLSLNAASARITGSGVMVVILAAVLGWLAVETVRLFGMLKEIPR